jgi:hypothetical protein
MKLSTQIIILHYIFRLLLIYNLLFGFSGVAYGKMHRSTTAKNEFKREYPCPSNGNNHGPCPGYVIDHIVPLACGGFDRPDNMQWQTIMDGKIKDRFELSMCGK